LVEAILKRLRHLLPRTTGIVAAGIEGATGSALPGQPHEQESRRRSCRGDEAATA
jgi:hypothetical protein